jgi:hypothetical protein
MAVSGRGLSSLFACLLSFFEGDGLFLNRVHYCLFYVVCRGVGLRW